MKNYIKNALEIVFVIIASIVGAGFASGKEIYSFFFIYGYKGVIGIFISSFLICLVIYKVFTICNKNKINTYWTFCNHIIKSKKFWSSILNNIVNIFLLISFFVMIAGFASLLEQELEINRIAGAAIIVILIFIVSLKNVNGLVKISNYLIPVFIIFLLILMIKNSNYLNVVTSKAIINSEFSLINNWVVKSILYASYNCVVLIPLIVIISSKAKNKKIFLKISVINFIVLIMLCLSVYNLLLLGNSEIFKLEMPIIAIVEKYGYIYKLIYIILIAISIFTTAATSMVSFLNNINLKNKKRKKFLLICVSLIAIPLAEIRFGALVECLYPTLGLIGLIEISVILRE